MSLYRTWRPKTFAELVGQEAVVRTLESAIASGKLAHAYLFSGPRGSGKTSAAKILARCVNCVRGPTPTPDNTCEFCLAMLAGTALDVLEIDAASNRGIDEIRSLRDAVKFAPAAMRMKVYIIDEAHMLTKEGANAFLKTLEEPPPHALFILATTEPEKLPVTILSRCQRYAFARIAIPVMIERMRQIATAESIAIDDSALSAIAYRADGGLRDALTMLEQAAAFADPGAPITVQTIDAAFGASGRDDARALLDRILARDAAGVLTTIEAASDGGIDPATLTRTLIAQVRNLLVARIDPALLERDLTPEDAQAAAARAKDVTQAQLVRALRLLADALAMARVSANARLELETALLRYVLAAEDPALDALGARVSALEGASPLVPAAPKAAKAAASNGPVTIARVRAAWQSVRTKVESQRASLRGELSRAMLHAVDGKALVVGVPNSYSAEILKDNAPLIEQAIEEVLGARLQLNLRVEAGAARGKGGAAPHGAPPQAPAEDAQSLLSYVEERIR